VTPLSCDGAPRDARDARGAAGVAREATQGRRPPVAAAAQLRLAALGLGISVVPLDTAVNIAFPDITGSFGLPITMIQWVIICYVLTNAGPLLAFGRLGDLWGHARVFRAGLLWSIAAFLLCAAAPSFGWLLFFRFLQGIAAALIISCAPALVTSLYPEARRSRALGTFTLIFALSSALGPLIGGALVARWGWPAVFWFRAPIALTSLVCCRGLPGGATGGGDRNFDMPGALLLAFGLAALVLGLNAIARLGTGDDIGLLLLPAAAMSFAGFLWWEGRAAHPIVRIDLFREASFTLINVAGVLMYLVTFTVMLFAPYFLRDHTALPVVAAGFVLASGFIAMAAFSPLAGSVVGRLGARRIAPLGAVIAGAGLFLVGFWQPGTPPPVMVATLALQGLGLALFQVAYIELVIAASPAAHRGVAGSLSMLTRTVGVVIAAALLTLAFHAIENARQATGAAPAFFAAYHAVFRGAGVVAMLTGGLLAWSGRRAARPIGGVGL
jgi:MFS family permease